MPTDFPGDLVYDELEAAYDHLGHLMREQPNISVDEWNAARDRYVGAQRVYDRYRAERGYDDVDRRERLTSGDGYGQSTKLNIGYWSERASTHSYRARDPASWIEDNQPGRANNTNFDPYAFRKDD